MQSSDITNFLSTINKEIFNSSISVVLVVILVAVGIYVISKNTVGSLLIGLAVMATTAGKVIANYNSIMQSKEQLLSQIPAESLSEIGDLNITNPWFILVSGALVAAVIIVILKLVFEKDNSTTNRNNKVEAISNVENIENNYSVNKTRIIKSRVIKKIK